MRHENAGRKLGRDSSHRSAMYRNMAESLIRFGRIQTTLQKAKELRRLADKLVTMGKTGTLASRRRAASILRTPETLDRLFGELASHFKDRPGGYTRIIRVGSQ